MKSFCKHCGQEYDDLPEEYLGQEVTCGSCEKNYVVIETVDCNYCGAANKPDASQCRKCGHALKQKSQSPSVPKLQPRHKPCVPDDKKTDSREGHGCDKLIEVIAMIVGTVITVFIFLWLKECSSHDIEWQSFTDYVIEEDSKWVDTWKSKKSFELSNAEIVNILEYDVMPHSRNIQSRCNHLDVSKLNNVRKKDYDYVITVTKQQIEGCEKIIKGLRSNDKSLVEKGFQILDELQSRPRYNLSK